MSQAKTAHAEMAVARHLLLNPRERRRIRMDLFEELRKLGRVQSVTYVRDPLDSPRLTPSDDVAVVRAVGRVVPS